MVRTLAHGAALYAPFVALKTLQQKQCGQKIATIEPLCRGNNGSSRVEAREKNINLHYKALFNNTSGALKSRTRAHTL